VTLKTGLGVCHGHWKCHHSIDCVWFPYSKFVPETHRFSDIRLVSVHTRVSPGHSRSSEPTRIDPPPSTSC